MKWKKKKIFLCSILEYQYSWKDTQQTLLIYYTYYFALCFDLVKHLQNESDCIQFPFEQCSRVFNEWNKTQKKNNAKKNFMLRYAMCYRILSVRHREMRKRRWTRWRKNEKKNAIVNNQWCKMFIIVNVMKTNRRSSEITTNHKRK